MLVEDHVIVELCPALIIAGEMDAESVGLAANTVLDEKNKYAKAAMEIIDLPAKVLKKEMVRVVIWVMFTEFGITSESTAPTYSE